jgi:hypothetical protein
MSWTRLLCRPIVDWATKMGSSYRDVQLKGGGAWEEAIEQEHSKQKKLGAGKHQIKVNAK